MTARVFQRVIAARAAVRLARLVVLAAALFVLAVAGSGGAFAQFCPSGSTQIQNGYAIECRCPDGSLAGYSGCPSAAPPPPLCPAGMSYCADNNMCCGSGSYCSHYGCTPIGAVECGTHYCNPGQQCSRSGGCQPAGSVDCGEYYCQPGQRCGSNFRACLTASDIDCGSYSCGAGNKCSSAGCIPQNAADCGNKSYCHEGSKCSRNGKSCMPLDAVDCGDHVCGAGSKCGTGNQCLARDAIDCGKGASCGAGQKCSRGGGCVPQQSVDCGNGSSCPLGKLCVKGGAECLTAAELEEQNTYQRRLATLGTAQRKEDEAATDWLAREQARLARQAAENQRMIAATRSRLHDQAVSIEEQLNPARKRAASQRGPADCDPPQQIVQNIIGGVSDPRPVCKTSAVAGPAAPQGNVVTTIIPGKTPAQDTTVVGPLQQGAAKQPAQPAATPQGGKDNRGPTSAADSAASPISANSSAKQAGPTASSTALVLNPDLKNIVSLSAPAPASASGTAGQQPSFASSASFSKSGPGQSGIWSRLESSIASADNRASTSPKFQDGKKQIELTAAAATVGCAAGALVGGGLGAAAGGVPAVPGAGAGCLAGAELSTATLGAVQSVYGAAQQAGALLNKQPVPGGVRASVTDASADLVGIGIGKAVGTGPDLVPVVPVLEVEVTWGTYFMQSFYSGSPGN